MQTTTPSELQMWKAPVKDLPDKLTDDEINEKYANKEWRIITEMNREQLPNFVQAFSRTKWMNLEPKYQRRRRWDQERKSRLIESFIMNVPIPPVFVYEVALAKYEVMDGQQRIRTIREFYANEFKLKGLERWPELNGRTYSKLPTSIKDGIDRRSISYIVLLKESARTTEEEAQLKQLVFERLNTGGVELSKQEVRNCLYSSLFNDLLFRCARNDVFRAAWGLPDYSEEEDVNPPESLLSKAFYAQMTDVELVLRFFALRHAEHYTRGMKGFLDIYMQRASSFVEVDIALLEKLFIDTLTLGRDLFGDLLFKPYLLKQLKWSDRAQTAFYDASMVALSRNLDVRENLIANKESIVESIRQMFLNNAEGTFTGRGNTKADVQDRIRLMSDCLRNSAK